MLQKAPPAVHISKQLDPFSLTYLQPPPSMPFEYVPRRHIQLSPLCPPNASVDGRGLERTLFEEMLNASRERSAMLVPKKPVGLRKEIAVKAQKVKAQKVKQLQRRARFLNKLCEPPSPSAVDSPATPPHSPTVFHFTLPSPGLQSPLEVFEDVHDHPERYEIIKRVEQVDFRLPYEERVNPVPHRHSSLPVKNNIKFPSLDQISQRLNKSPVLYSADGLASQGRRREKSRLPSFLRSPSYSPPPQATLSYNNQLPRRPRPALAPLALYPAIRPGHPVIQSPMPHHATLADLSCPTDKGLPESKITMAFYPPSRSMFPHTETTQFVSEQSEVVCEVTMSVSDDIPTLGLRAQVARDMFHKLSRRTPGLSTAAVYGVKARDDMSLACSPGCEVEDKQRRRTSAPAGVPASQMAAHHPVLEKPGGF